MRTSTSTLSTLTSLLIVADALPELQIAKLGRRDAATSGLVKRQGTVETNVYDILTYSTGGAYYANVTVGTPAQPQVVILDTGSADLYFDASTAAACEATGPYSCRGGTFTPKDSSTYSIADPSPAFNTSFGDGSSASGPFGEDVIGLGDERISGVQFGVAEDVNSTTGYAIGLMGLGYSAIEATAHFYPNMPEVLRDTGVINSRLYSVFLASLSQISGTILFGGVDTSRFSGELVTLDILPDMLTGIVDQFVTTITAMASSANGTTTSLFSGGHNSVAAYGSDDYALAVLLDTGSSAWSVPTSYYNNYIAPLYPFVDKYGACRCSETGPDLILEFGARLNITVPFAELIVPLYNSTTDAAEPYDTAGNAACVFMVVPAEPTGEGFQTLGDAVLRSMYVVFDLDNGQLSVAQAANTTGSGSVLTVPAGASGLASVLTSHYSAAAATQTASIAPEVLNATQSFSVSTAQSTIGSATGTAAVPADAQIGSGGATASKSGSSAAATSKGAAASINVLGDDYKVVGAMMWAVLMGGLGVGLVL